VPYLSQVEPTGSFRPFLLFQENFGFIPNLFRAQTLLPRVIEVEAEIAGTVLLKPGALSRALKEMLLLTVAAHNRNSYCVTAHCRLLRDLGIPAARITSLIADHRQAGLGEEDAALIDFALKLARWPTHIGRGDVEGLRRRGLEDVAILETIVVTALTQFLCTLSTGLGVRPDFEPVPLPEARPSRSPPPRAGEDSAVCDGQTAEPYLRALAVQPESFPPFAFFRDSFGFVPNIFRAQTLRPDLVEAEAKAVGAVLLSQDILPRTLKEYILLTVSAANLNTYCVAVHCEMLRNLGIPIERSDRIAVDHRNAGLDPREVALLDFALQLALQPDRFGVADIEALRGPGLRDVEILEAIVMVSLTQFLNTLQMGLGPVPDIHPPRVFPRQSADSAGDMNLSAGPSSLTDGGGGPSGAVDPDRDFVTRAREGDLEAFEHLVRRHARCVYRTVVGITGNEEDAEDAMQTAFMKAFQHMGEFRGTARFSTWLVRIAINEGLEKVRGRRAVESLDWDTPDSDDETGYRPRRLEAWTDDPERLLARRETRSLVEAAILTLPPKYRVPVLLRDLEQMTTEEAAAATGLPVATLKTRLLRGRLMLREALAPHFAAGRRD